MRWSPGVYYANPRSSNIGTLVKSDIFNASPSYTSDMVYNGLATLFVRYEWKKIETQADADNNPFSGTIPQVQVSMLGKRVASLEIANPQDFTYETAITRYSTNPAECLLDYLRNPRYGKGLNNDDIDWTTWKKAGAKCNTTVTYVASGITGPILTMNMVLNTESTLMGNTKLMLQNFRAYMPFVQGKYKLRIEDAGNDDDILSGAATIAQTFTKDDIVSDITFNGIERSAKYNVVSVTYVDPDQKWSNQQVIYPETEAERQVYIDLDGGRENKYDTTLGGITNYAIAKDFARLIFNKQRRQESCVFTATSKALELEPGDCIRIQSNILNFGTDPWRIVSYKVNNNMTVDLGCVRNPDDIYPYVRVGEEDIVAPTYVPKGSTIYYPSSQNLPPVGLVPPSNALYPDGYNPTNTHPGPTNPDGPTGGGNGGGGNSSTENNTPLNPPSPLNFNGILTYKSISYKDFNNGNYNFNLVFTQPVDTLYQRSVLWWRADSSSPYQEIAIATLPGAGKDINITVGPLPKGTYEYFLRSYASDGRASLSIVKGSFGYTNLLASDPTFSGFLGVETQVAVEGWSLASTPSVVTPGYDDSISSIYIKPKTPNVTPRKLTVSITQISNIAITPINRYIKGVRIYYKNKLETYWRYEDYVFPLSYTPGETLTFDMVATFGTKIAPGVIVAGSVNDQLQQYDFITRLTYLDDALGTKHVGPGISAPIEQYNGQTNYTVWGTTSDSVSKVANTSISADWTSSFQTSDQDPAASFATIYDVIPNIWSVYLDTNSNVTLPWMDIRFLMPSGFSKFRGYRIRYRNTVVGPAQDFKVFDTGYVSTGINYIVSPSLPDLAARLDLDFDPSIYTLGYTDLVITALISTSSGIVEANESLVSRIETNTLKGGFYGKYGYVYNRDPSYSASTMSFTLKKTTDSIEELRATWPATPTINIKSWVKKTVTLNTGGIGAGVAERSEIEKYNNNFYLNRYYTVRFQLPPAAVNLIVYRRHYTPFFIQDYSGFPKYFRIGPWERISIAVSGLTADAEGWYNINLRGPVHWQYFNYSGTITPGQINSLYGVSGNWPMSSSSYPNNLNNVYPYGGTSSAKTGGSNDYHGQFLFVIQTATEQSKGIMLRSFDSPNTVSEYDGFVLPEVTRFLVDDTTIFNSMFDAGYGRRLSENIGDTVAITELTTEKVDAYNQVASDVYTKIPPARDVFNGAFTRFLQQPRNGDTVY